MKNKHDNEEAVEALSMKANRQLKSAMEKLAQVLKSTGCCCQVSTVAITQNGNVELEIRGKKSKLFELAMWHLDRTVYESTKEFHDSIPIYELSQEGGVSGDFLHLDNADSSGERFLLSATTDIFDCSSDDLVTFQTSLEEQAEVVVSYVNDVVRSLSDFANRFLIPLREQLPPIYIGGETSGIGEDA